MGEWAQLANTTGVALMVLAAVGMAMYRLGVLISRRVFGDPKANPPIKGWVDAWMDNQKDFHDRLTSHTERQQELCERHATAIDTIAGVLTTHDGLANHRTETLDELMKQHTDKNIPDSPAAAIDSIQRLRQAALATCVMGRELANGDREDMANRICSHCDAMEKILKEQKTS